MSGEWQFDWSNSLHIENKNSHIWSDALHARALARQTRSKWDRGTYVRWTVNGAWAALEICCCDALGIQKLDLDFKRSLDHELEKQGYEPLDWGCGIWQRVLCRLRTWRKDYTHMYCDWANLFPDVSRADEAITISREAVKNICRHVWKKEPVWIDSDENPGWQLKTRFFAYGHVVHAGVTEDMPDVVKVAYVDEEGEHLSDLCRPGTDPIPIVTDLMDSLKKPIKEVRVYKGNELVFRYLPVMRGGGLPPGVPD